MSEEDTQDLEMKDGEEEEPQPVEPDVHSPYQQAQMQAAASMQEPDEPPADQEK